ncbi:MAG: hypothetical protein WC600_17910, partial [Desulfobaccales bacterium]
NCFALLAEFRRAETLGRGFKSFERFSLEKGSSFVQQLRPVNTRGYGNPVASFSFVGVSGGCEFSFFGVNFPSIDSTAERSDPSMEWR